MTYYAAMKKPVLVVVFAALLAGILTGVAYFQWPKPKLAPPELEMTLLPEPKPVEPFRLTDQDGVAFGPERLTGKWSLLFFGYTHCPDICPTTLLTLNGFRKRLAEQGEGLDDIQFLFVSVDPQRDSPQHLKDYLAYFGPAYRGATGDRAQIDALVRQFGAVYMFEGDTQGDTYVVNHSATLYVVDPEGRLYARLLPPHEPAPMADTFVRLRHFYSR
jgi:protein SCO1/2